MSESKRSREVLALLRAFIAKHHLSEPACLPQSDRAQEGLIDLVNSCAKIVGWYEDLDGER